MEARLQDDEVIAVDKIDKTRFVGDSPGPGSGEHMAQRFGLSNSCHRISQRIVNTSRCQLIETSSNRSENSSRPGIPLRREVEREAGFRRPGAGVLCLGHKRHSISVTLDGQVPFDGLFCGRHARPVAAVRDRQVRNDVRELALERWMVRKRFMDQCCQRLDRLRIFRCEPEDVVTEPCCARQPQIERRDDPKEMSEPGQKSYINLFGSHEREEHGEMCWHPEAGAGVKLFAVLPDCRLGLRDLEYQTALREQVVHTRSLDPSPRTHSATPLAESSVG